jgi:hypothetical protein
LVFEIVETIGVDLIVRTVIIIVVLIAVVKDLIVWFFSLIEVSIGWLIVVE